MNVSETAGRYRYGGCGWVIMVGGISGGCVGIVLRWAWWIGRSMTRCVSGLVEMEVELGLGGFIQSQNTWASEYAARTTPSAPNTIQ